MNRGHAFRDGTLYIFDEDSVEVLRPWGPCAGAWRKEPPGGWQGFHATVDLNYMKRTARDVERALDRLELWMPFDGEEGLPFPPSAYVRHRAAAYRAFLGEIPDGVRRVVQRLGDAHWQALQLVNRCGESAADLLESTPALGMAVAARGRFDRSLARMRSARTLLRLRQRDAAGRLGFPASEAMVKVLRKIPPGIATLRRLLYLRVAAKDPVTLRRLAHVPRLSPPLLRVITDPVLAPSVSDGYLHELGRLSGVSPNGSYPWMLREVLQLEERLGLPRPGPFASTAQVERRHQEIVRALTTPGGQVLPGIAFAPPPFAGTDCIEPILDTTALVTEGVSMKHCVAGYTRDAIDGSRAFYRVLAPERATLSIIRTPTGWEIDDLRGPANAEPAPRTRRAVVVWLRTAPRPVQLARTLDADAEPDPEFDDEAS